MKCERAFKLLPDYCVGGLRPAERAQIQAHLSDCPACRHELSALEAAGRLVQSMPVNKPARDLWPGIADAIRAEQTRVPWWKRLIAPAARNRWAVAAAAVIVLALVVGILLNPFSTRPQLADEPDPESAVYSEWYAGTAWNAPLADRSGIALALAYAPDEEALAP